MTEALNTLCTENADLKAENERREQPVVACEAISGKSLLETFNRQRSGAKDYLTLEEHIDIAIDMAMREAARNQVQACVEAVASCELVEPNVRRIRLDEAVGACCSSNIYTLSADNLKLFRRMKR